jgi:hypothetical protein
MFTRAPPPLAASTGANVRDTAQIVHFQFPPRAFQGAVQQARSGLDTGVVDDDRHVGCRCRGGRDLVVVGDVES